MGGCHDSGLAAGRTRRVDAVRPLAAPAGAEPRAEDEGVVVAVEQSTTRITLDHGPIPGVMPVMRMRFRSLSAQKAVLLNVWASWCVACRTEMPAIERPRRSGKEAER